ncbi:FecR family protein [bacterium A37T11]|nr:FecR family protein [bacterium A37T11]
MDNESQLKQLYQKFLRGECRPDEVKALLEHFEAAGENGELSDMLERELARQNPDAMDNQERINSLLKRADQRIPLTVHKSLPVPKMGWEMKLLAAAALLVALAIGIYFLSSRRPINPQAQMVAQKDILPGYNKATLTLANGSKIDLDSAKAGIRSNGSVIVYNDGTAIKAPIHATSSITYNSLTTPRGGQYQIILPDGTMVWLNAASTLKYPSKFSGDRREVELEGEAYFQVINKQADPFIVNTKSQSITVLGTSFNVSAYADERQTITTLITGKVRVSQGAQVVELIPGEQSAGLGTSLNKSKIDVGSAIGWKEGLFSFNEEPLESIMRKIARWYNIDVVFADDGLRNKVFVGVIDRLSHVSEVLDMLRVTGKVDFNIDGRKITVIPKNLSNKKPPMEK